MGGAGGEGAAAGDGDDELGAVEDGVEFCDGGGELELEAGVVEEVGGENGGVAEFGGVGAAVEDAGYAGEAGAAYDAVGVGVDEAVEVGAEEDVVARR